jgi:FkbM family methyltransferase
MNRPFNFVSVPGTNYVFLRGDANMAKHALAKGTILIDDEMAALPEVQALGPEDFVLDVGAFIGDTALLFAKNGAEVWAFEPQADAYQAALHNTKNNGGKIILSNSAIGNKQKVRLNQDGINGNLGTRTVSPSDDGVKSVRLDGLRRVPSRTVTFVKIDVEGFEPSVIAGALELFKRDKPTLLIEVYPEMLKRQGFEVNDIYGPLQKLGYIITEAIGNSTEPRWDILCKMPTQTEKTLR